MKPKACTTCGMKLPISSFGKHRITKDGLSHVCRECASRKSDMAGGIKIRTMTGSVHTRYLNQGSAIICRNCKTVLKMNGKYVSRYRRRQSGLREKRTTTPATALYCLECAKVLNIIVMD